MKKSKLLILLGAVLIVAIAACVVCIIIFNPNNTDSDPIETSEIASESAVESGSESESTTEETVETDVSDEQKYADHEMHSYFDLSVKEEATPVLLDSKIDGEQRAVDTKNSLMVVVKKTVDALDIEETVVKVYDLLTGEVIREDSVKSPYGLSASDGVVTIDVTLHYPVIRVEKTTYTKADVGEDVKPQKEISYYVAEKDGELIYTTADDSIAKFTYDNGLVCVLMGDKYVWIDRDMNVIRSVDAILTNYNYIVEPTLFQSEYKGYLYSYDYSKLMVFNHAGLVCAQYATSDKTASINCLVLDNGNVLVQETTIVGAYGSCDFVISGTRFDIKSMIVDHVTGAITDVDLDYLVFNLETEYEQEGTDPDLKLANGSDNLAVIYKIANGAISDYASLCVLNNACEIVYTVENDTFGVDFSEGIEYIGREKYVVKMTSNGNAWRAIFDIGGNFICVYHDDFTQMTDDYIVNNTTINSYEMGLVYDFAADGYELVTVMGNDVYLKKTNYESGRVEIYRYAGRGKVELVMSDLEGEYYHVDEDYYILYNEKTEAYTVYNTAGEEIIVSHERLTPYDAGNDITLFSTAFNGEPIVYVVK